ncbi:type IV secretory system conjugative DNA transfer family protein [Streptomyces hundungensis]|uniref:type IV secretory system conjugative DNA transfer family protein n=1 Tax=Streptomyces hundungensis TaxID=1077946 RepID=UPI0033E81AA2
MPDSLLVGLLAFLLGLTVLVWTATGLGGLFTQGAWPPGVSFTHSPMALRALVTAPHDLPAAWPDTPPSALSGYGLFWGLLIGELLIVIVLTIFALGTFTRWRAVRARARLTPGPATTTAPTPGVGPGPASAVPLPYAAAHQAPPTPAAEPPLPYPAQPIGPAQPMDAAQPPLPYPAQPIGPAQPMDAAQPLNTGRPLETAQPLDTGRPTDAAHPGDAHPATPAPALSAVTPGSTQLPSAAPEFTAPPTEHIPLPRAEQPTPRLLFGAPESRRPAALQAIRDAEGPALVVTSDATLWAETKDARAKLGPVHVYDPTHRCDTPARLHWSPAAGCEDQDTAAARAAALLAPVRPQARMDAAMADTAETLLRCWLHAAALESRDGKAIKQLHRWAQGTAAHEAVRILRTHPKAQSGGAGLLESALTAYPERREIAQQLTARALDCLSSLHIREACTPNRADSLALESFVNEGGTLYVVGEAIEDPRSHPAAMPLLTALASDVVERGRRMAERSSDGRLDPPMTLVLDDVAAVAPLPQLPELLSTGRPRGLHPLALLRSPEQARARWTEALT